MAMWLMQSMWGAVVLLITMGLGFVLGAFSRYQPTGHVGRHRPEVVRRIVAERLE